MAINFDLRRQHSRGVKIHHINKKLGVGNLEDSFRGFRPFT